MALPSPRHTMAKRSVGNTAAVSDGRKESKILKEYRAGTFDRRVAYGQRHRKLVLVARGIMDGFRVRCRSERAAGNLAHAFRSRCAKIEAEEYAHYAIRVRVKGRTVIVTRKAAISR